MYPAVFEGEEERVDVVGFMQILWKYIKSLDSRISPPSTTNIVGSIGLL